MYQTASQRALMGSAFSMRAFPGPPWSCPKGILGIMSPGRCSGRALCDTKSRTSRHVAIAALLRDGLDRRATSSQRRMRRRFGSARRVLPVSAGVLLLFATPALGAPAPHVPAPRVPAPHAPAPHVPERYAPELDAPSATPLQRARELNDAKNSRPTPDDQTDRDYSGASDASGNSDSAMILWLVGGALLLVVVVVVWRPWGRA